ncbi:hypothetical protein [Bradyrhizobium sp. SZCCHNRI1003]|uniref:hypothetical protein n=1 Tax=Bradyrhizobium sp. SZCCHNRI1003 TaxID=3057275 RepID=UPI002916A3AC|nr:hypothetical protein [Bradyrhizobium sp. SZCCHNRI1003]
MSDVMTWGAMLAALGALGTILGFWTRYSDRITKAESRAQIAEHAAEEAKKKADAAQDRITLLDQAFALYRERVAYEYTSRETLREVENRLADAIDKLGDRFDRALEQRAHHQGG